MINLKTNNDIAVWGGVELIEANEINSGCCKTSATLRKTIS